MLPTVWYLGASLIAQLVKNLPAMQETLVWFLGREDELEKGLATHSSILNYTAVDVFIPLEWIVNIFNISLKIEGSLRAVLIS